jgi:hypothetical protein
VEVDRSCFENDDSATFAFFRNSRLAAKDRKDNFLAERRKVLKSSFQNLTSDGFSRDHFGPGLPDGFFLDQKSKIPTWVYFGGPWNGKLLYILAIRNILLPLVIFYGHLVILKS